MNIIGLPSVCYDCEQRHIVYVSPENPPGPLPFFRGQCECTDEPGAYTPHRYMTDEERAEWGDDEVAA